MIKNETSLKIENSKYPYAIRKTRFYIQYLVQCFRRKQKEKEEQVIKASELAKTLTIAYILWEMMLAILIIKIF